MPISITILRAAGLSDTEILRVIEQQEIVDEAAKAKVREQTRERTRRWRERMRDVCDASPSSPASHKEERKEPKERRKVLTEVTNVTSVRTLERAFEDFKQAYPKREGSDPPAPARKSFDKAVNSGVDPQTIIVGAQAYAQSTRETEPRFIKQRATWLNQRCWEEHITDVDPELAQQRREYQERKRQYQARMEGNGHDTQAQVRRDTGMDDQGTGHTNEPRSEGGVSRR